MNSFIYNPTKNPIKLEENRYSPNFTKTTSNRYAGLQPGVNKVFYYSKCSRLVLKYTASQVKKKKKKKKKNGYAFFSDPHFAWCFYSTLSIYSISNECRILLLCTEVENSVNIGKSGLWPSWTTLGSCSRELNEDSFTLPVCVVRFTLVFMLLSDKLGWYTRMSYYTPGIHSMPIGYIRIYSYVFPCICLPVCL